MNKIIIQYQTHQELLNKNSLTEMKCQLRKMETPHNQITHNQTTQRKTTTRKKKERKEKINLENLKRIMNSEKTTLP